MQMLWRLYPRHYTLRTCLPAPPLQPSDFCFCGSPHPEDSWESLLVSVLILNEKTLVLGQSQDSTLSSPDLKTRMPLSALTHGAPHLQDNHCPSLNFSPTSAHCLGIGL